MATAGPCGATASIASVRRHLGVEAESVGHDQNRTDDPGQSVRIASGVESASGHALVRILAEPNGSDPGAGGHSNQPARTL